MMSGVPEQNIATMIFRQRFLDGICSGTVTLAFRRWRRPTVRAGGTLLTPVGQLQIAGVTEVALEGISDGDARRAGYESRAVLVAELNARQEGVVYRIDFGPLGPDPRTALRASPANTEAERSHLLEQLQRFDARAGGLPWTRRVLEILGAHPGVRAGDLCHLAGQEKDQFKVNVRKLKQLGLTESLETGYRLSTRGASILETLRTANPPAAGQRVDQRS